MIDWDYSDDDLWFGKSEDDPRYHDDDWYIPPKGRRNRLKKFTKKEKLERENWKRLLGGLKPIKGGLRLSEFQKSLLKEPEKYMLGRPGEPVIVGRSSEQSAFIVDKKARGNPGDCGATGGKTSGSLCDCKCMCDSNKLCKGKGSPALGMPCIKSCQEQCARICNWEFNKRARDVFGIVAKVPNKRECGSKCLILCQSVKNTLISENGGIQYCKAAGRMDVSKWVDKFGTHLTKEDVGYGNYSTIEVDFTPDNDPLRLGAVYNHVSSDSESD